MELWKETCKGVDESSVKSAENALGALELCNKTHYPAVHVLLKLFATLPCSSATAERSFSALKYLKSERRNAMTADRLSGLLLPYSNKDIEIKNSEIVDEFAKSSRRFLL